MKILRFALLLCLALCLTFSLAACGYKAVPSTAEEAAAVMTLDGKYQIPYELFRFVFLQKKQADSDGKEDYFKGKDKKALLEAYTAEAVAEAAKVYALFSLCEKYGVDPYAEEIDEKIDEEIAFIIEGDDYTPGYGSHKTYLAEIKKQFLNDSVYRLFLRYDLCEQRLAAKLKQDKVITAKWEDVFAHYSGEDTVCVSWILLPYANLGNFTEAQRQRILNEARAKTNEDFCKMAAEFSTTQVPDELVRGVYFGRYEYDDLYRELVDTAFSLEEGETSDIFFSGDGLYILRRLPKNPAYLANEDNREDLEEGYMLDLFGKMLAEEETRLVKTVTYTDAYRDITFDSVKMPEEK